MTFDKFFTTATGGNQPYDYQRRLADDPQCQSRLIEIPTGLGKTAAVVLAWLWTRVIVPSLNSQPSTHNPSAWPRRLVYCLPMRTLVEQTAGEVKKWLENLCEEAEELGLNEDVKAKLKWLKENSPIILMGGEESGEWDIHPEREAILIGTQDMLLSRALNRGYGMSRDRWPTHFGLLNADALWVMDETQLMGPALWTSAQLDWMRQDRFPSLFPCPTWWMSATVGAAFLKTSDRERAKFPRPPSLVLGDEPNASVQLGACRPCELWTAPPAPKKSATRTKKAAVEANSPEVEFASALGNAWCQSIGPGRSRSWSAIPSARRRRSLRRRALLLVERFGASCSRPASARRAAKTTSPRSQSLKRRMPASESV